MPVAVSPGVNAMVTDADVANSGERPVDTQTDVVNSSENALDTHADMVGSGECFMDTQADVANSGTPWTGHALDTHADMVGDHPMGTQADVAISGEQAMGTQADVHMSDADETAGGDVGQHDTHTADDFECVICQGTREEYTEYTIRGCLHRFHEACWRNWVQAKACPMANQTPCPVCKRSDADMEDLANNLQVLCFPVVVTELCARIDVDVTTLMP